MSRRVVNPTMSGVAQGSRDGYRWLWARDATLRGLLDTVPELVRGKIVAVTSFDSGPLRLSEEDLASGWQSDGVIAYSPPVADIPALPLGEWDEWYVFSQMRSLAGVEVFVNYGDFTPNPDREVQAQGPGWDHSGAEEALRHSLARTERFWTQLNTVRPVSFLAENDAMICVTRDEDAFVRAIEYVTQASMPPVNSRLQRTPAAQARLGADEPQGRSTDHDG